MQTDGVLVYFWVPDGECGRMGRVCYGGPRGDGQLEGHGAIEKEKVLGELAPRAGQEREKILAGYPRALNLLTATPTLYDNTIT